MSSNLRNEIGNLSASEKFELIDTLWQSLETEAPVLTDEQSAELDRRMARYERDPSNVVPWEQVKTGLFKQS